MFPGVFNVERKGKSPPPDNHQYFIVNYYETQTTQQRVASDPKRSRQGYISRLLPYRLVHETMPDSDKV
ncbi:unnamed protein product, partial [Nesidiocoris tenuis]